MGAWDCDPFGNDTAGDWAFDLENKSDLSFIEETLQKVLSSGNGDLEASDAEEAIAAADTLARLKGKFYVRNPYTEPVDEWVADHPLTPSRALLDTAIQAIDRVLTKPSELLEAWEESEQFDQWKKHLTDLKQRLV
jgi:Domain of unknown function (DUF4259)